MQLKPHPDSAVIKAIGGTNVVAALCGTTAGAVSQWRAHGIPQLRRFQIRERLRAKGEPIPPGLQDEPAAADAE